MALEDKVEDLTSAIRELIVAITGVQASPPLKLEITGNALTKSAKKPKSDALASAPSKSSEPIDVPVEKTASSPSGASQPKETENAAAEADEVTVDFETMANQFRKLLQTDRDSAVALLAGLGVKKLGDLDESKYAEANAKIEELLG